MTWVVSLTKNYDFKSITLKYKYCTSFSQSLEVKSKYSAHGRCLNSGYCGFLLMDDLVSFHLPGRKGELDPLYPLRIMETSLIQY